MSDRFNGSIALGGQLTREQYDRCSELAKDCFEFEGGFDEDGSARFYECRSENFKDLIEYCKANSIALCLYWDGDLGFDPIVQYWIAGHFHEYTTTSEGDIVVMVSELLQNPKMTVEEYLETLGIPTFPTFSIAE